MKKSIFRKCLTVANLINMTKYNTLQQRNIEIVLRRFQDMDEIPRWNKIDDSMSCLEWLDDKQLVQEVVFLSEAHKNGNPRCRTNHPKRYCLVPRIISAVEDLLAMYKQTGQLSDRERYIFQYYLSLSHAGDIVY